MIISPIKTKPITFFWYFIACLPILLFFYTFIIYAVNIPFLDDFTFFSFIPILYNNSNGFNKISVFFSQHNEHRILTDRVVALLIYAIKGNVDYEWMMLVGNSFLVGILVIYFKVFQQLNLSFKYFVSLSFLIFNTQIFENSFWGMASVQNYGVILFVLILFYLISSSKRNYFYFSFIIAFLATYTSGNGILGSIVASILLLLQNRIKDCLIFSVFSLFLLGSYFYGYISPPTINYFNGVTSKDILIGFFSFLGAALDIFRNYSFRYIFTTSAGFIAFLGIGFFFRTSIFRSKLFYPNKALNQVELFILGSILFILVTTVIVVITRVNFGQNSLLASRYRLYSILLFINLYFAALFYLKVGITNKIIFPVLLIAICYNLISNYQSNYDVVALNKTRNCGLANDIMANINKPIQSGILVYQKSPLWFDEFLPQFQKPIANSPIWGEEYSLKKSTLFLFVIENSTESYLKKNQCDGVYLLLQSHDNTYILPTNQRRNSIKNFLQTGQLWTNGFIGDFTRKQILVGNYQLGIWMQKNNKGESFYLNDSLSIK
ncbi:hypothetical protein VB264_13700 [Arcicella aquatica]|uniref:Uncharacterized protein n=1 Tax=Arcicella aquatica TaxID=217141 RepID=A0ABU5QR19_9BACT|nr:hypothetical protein [Arcicella aquatica]MEA5258846.1 hypothetical protein [Arcicella aquatica]